MASGALEWICWFVEVGKTFLGILPISRVLRWPVPRIVLRVVAASPSLT
jgi:hypothetical protein